MGLCLAVRIVWLGRLAERLAIVLIEIWKFQLVFGVDFLFGFSVFMFN